MHLWRRYSLSPNRSPAAPASIMLALVLPMIIILIQTQFTQAVNLARYYKLEKEEFLHLDSDVSEYYKQGYDTLSRRNVSYEEQLYKSIRSIRHTIVINHFDYMYTDEKVMERSIGKRVNDDRCIRQLEALTQVAEIAAMSDDSHLNVPISALNFLEASGRSEPGVLNGNFVWWGSDPTCLRARISADLLKAVEGVTAKLAGEEDQIVGRHCIAHLKAKSWPSNDPYFENRLSIKLGLCLPDSCHSISYFRSAQVRQLVESLAKSGLVSPYNSQRFHIDYLYCLPDEDSPHREYDTGALAFVGFVIFWLAMLAYCSLKYEQRQRTMQKLRNSVDIRMIINQERETGNAKADESNSGQESSNSKTGDNNNLKLPDESDHEDDRREEEREDE